MGLPLIIAGVAVIGYALDKFGDATEGSAQLVKWSAVAGGVYVSYRALKAAGALK